MPIHAPRPARSADIAALADIAQAAFSRYIPRIGRPPAAMEQDYEDFVERGLVHVVDSAAGPVGFVVMAPSGDALRIETLAVDPDHQHEGIGRTLLGFAEVRARQLELDRIELAVDGAMWETIALYARLGYKETDRREQDGSSRICLRKDLGYHR